MSQESINNQSVKKPCKFCKNKNTNSFEYKSIWTCVNHFNEASLEYLKTKNCDECNCPLFSENSNASNAVFSFGNNNYHPNCWQKLQQLQ